MKQIWHDLLFAHWPVPAESLRPLVPKQLTLDVFKGQCWVGVVPFWMSGVRPRGFPPLPWLSRFPELNVRTYVTYRGKPGVYFFSLDATSRAAVWAARKFYHLPYFHAKMKSRLENGSIHYSSARHSQRAEFEAMYQAISPVRAREKQSMEHFLTERYCLYAIHENGVCRCDIHHLPWPLQDAEAEIQRNTVAAAAQITLSPARPLLHFAKELEVLIWPLRCAE
jgi:uncharacterized protein YqjF (DUF2071 family)